MAESLIKIDNDYLEKTSATSCEQYFGTWLHNVENLKEKFINAKPFEHIVIDDFLNLDYAEKLHDLFPTNHDNWHVYMNPIEVKYTYDNIENLPIELKNYFYYLSHEKIVEAFQELTGIPNLTYDEYLHGAGLHCHPKNGRLNVHLDYEKHPYSGKERRINVIYFLSKEWNPEWNGQNELWNESVSQCVTKTEIKFNRAIIFKTNDISWHGLPEKITCPENMFRKSLAYYYVSPLNTHKPEESYRKKAKYIKRPTDEFNSGLEELYKIRPHRRITKEDMIIFCPDWKITD